MSFNEIMDRAIDINFANRQKKFKFSLSRFDYYKNFCTITVNTGRGTGKTKWIQDHVGFNDLVILPTLVQVDHFYKSVPDITSVTTFNSSMPFLRGSRKGIVNVYIDNFSEYRNSFYYDGFLQDFIASEYVELEHTFFLIG